MRRGIIAVEDYSTANSGIKVDYISNSSGSILLNITEPMAGGKVKSPMQARFPTWRVLCQLSAYRLSV
jgi:hypothetical protein